MIGISSERSRIQCPLVREACLMRRNDMGEIRNGGPFQFSLQRRVAADERSMIQDAEKRVIFIQFDRRVDVINARRCAPVIEPIYRLGGNGKSVGAEQRRSGRGYG